MHIVEDIIVENKDILPEISIDKDDVRFMSKDDLKNVIIEAVDEVKEENAKEEIAELRESDIAIMTKPELVHIVEDIIVENEDIFPEISIDEGDAKFMSKNELKDVIM